MGISLETGFQLEAVNGPTVIDVGLGAQPLQDIYEQSATQKHPLGTLLKYPDGRKFRYAKAGAVALAKALMTAGPIANSKYYEELQSTSGTAVEIGDQEIIVDITTSSGMTDNDLAGGVLVVNKATGIGDMYNIIANKLVTATTARILLETPIRTAWAADTEITMLTSAYSGVLVFPTTAAYTANDKATGVPLIAVTAAYYCWLQRAGDCPGLVDAGDTIVTGEPVGKPGTNGTAGGFGLVANDGTDDVWGRVRYPATSAECAIVELTLE